MHGPINVWYALQIFYTVCIDGHCAHRYCALQVLASPISGVPGQHRLLGRGTRCDKGRQSYIFWIKEGTRHDRAGGAKLYILDKCQHLSPELRSGSILRRTDCLPAQGHCSRQISVNCSFVATIYFGVFYLSSSEGGPLSYESVLYLRWQIVHFETFPGKETFSHNWDDIRDRWRRAGRPSIDHTFEPGRWSFALFFVFVMMAASVMSDTRFEIAEKRIEVDQKTNLISIVHCSHDDPIFSLTMMMMTMMAMMTTMMMTVVMATWWEGMEWSILGSNK